MEQSKLYDPNSSDSTMEDNPKKLLGPKTVAERCFMAVSGMSCSSCVEAIESTLLRQPGIFEVKIALISNSAEVVYDPAVIKPEQIVQLLDDLGFDSKITRTSDSCEESEIVVEIVVGGTDDGTGGEPNWSEIELELNRVIGIKALKIDRSTRQISILYFKEQIGPRTIVQSITGQLRPGSKVRVVEYDAMQQSLKLMRADVAKWRQSFLISLFFTVPTVVAMIYFMRSQMAERDTQLLMPGLSLKNVIFFVLATPVQLYTSRHFYKQSYRSIVKMHRANMDVLIAMATTVAYGYSVLIVVYSMIYRYKFSPNTFFDTPPMMVTFISLGRYIEHRTRLSATEALFNLCNSTPTDATLVHLEHSSGPGIVITREDVPSSSSKVENHNHNQKFSITKEETISVSLIETGDYLRISPEQIIPVDGKVFDGSCHVSESLITGEPGEIVKESGSILYGGSVNKSGTIIMLATGVGRDTTIAQIYKLIQEAQTTKPEIQKFADQIAAGFVPTVVALSVVVFGIWLVIGHYFLKQISLIYPDTSIVMTSTELITQFAVLCAVNVLIISCPCALGIATPTAVAAASAIGLELGLLIKGAIPLEQAGRIKYALIDKTGTLTEGKPTVTGMRLLSRVKRVQNPTESALLLQKLFALIGIAETSSTHPIAYSVINYVRQRLQMTSDSSFGVCTQFELHTGMGVHCTIDSDLLESFLKSIKADQGLEQHLKISDGMTLEDHQISAPIIYANYVNADDHLCGMDDQFFESKSFEVLIGNKRLMSKYDIEVNEEIDEEMYRLELKGETVFLVAINSVLVGMVSVADRIKPNAALAVYTLKKQYGVQLVMLTGDNATSAWKVAKQVGINKVYAELLPAHKLEKIGQLQQGGRSVAMIGDGLNDAPALQKANVGIAFAQGNQIALNSAGIILVRNDILDVVVALHLARKTSQRVRSNFLLAVIYNSLMIPAAGGLYFVFFGGMLRPWVSSLLMVLSSLSVVSNSLWLRKFYRKPTKESLETEEFRRMYRQLQANHGNSSSELPAINQNGNSGTGAATTTTAINITVPSGHNYEKLNSAVSLMSLHGMGNLVEGTGVQNPRDIDRTRQKELWSNVQQRQRTETGTGTSRANSVIAPINDILNNGPNSNGQNILFKPSIAESGQTQHRIQNDSRQNGLPGLRPHSQSTLEEDKWYKDFVSNNDDFHQSNNQQSLGHNIV